MHLEEEVILDPQKYIRIIDDFYNISTHKNYNQDSSDIDVSSSPNSNFPTVSLQSLIHCQRQTIIID